MAEVIIQHPDSTFSGYVRLAGRGMLFAQGFTGLVDLTSAQQAVLTGLGFGVGGSPPPVVPNPYPQYLTDRELRDALAALPPSGITPTEIAAQVGDPTTPIGTALKAFVPKWKANTAYAAGDPVVDPTGVVVTALAGFTSGATYDPGKWKRPPAAASGPKLTSLSDFGGSAIPKITKYAGNPIADLTKAGLTTIYWPHLIRVPNVVYAANPTLGRWRLYLGTDHDSNAGGIAFLHCNAVNPDDSGATWVGYRTGSGGAKIFNEGAGSQTETPTIVWNPLTQLFHLYYQIQRGAGATLLQVTRVATSPDGVTFTVVGDALPNPPGTMAGHDHTGYFKAWFVDGKWVGWGNMGSGTTVSAGVLWYSDDGFRWIRDDRRMRGNLGLTEGTLRTGLGGLVRYQGQIYATGTSGTFTSGITTSDINQSWIAPVNPDLRSLRGRPQYVDFAASGIETETPGIPHVWAPADDGRLWGAYRIGGPTGTIGLAVMA